MFPVAFFTAVNRCELAVVSIDLLLWPGLFPSLHLLSTGHSAKCTPVGTVPKQMLCAECTETGEQASKLRNQPSVTEPYLLDMGHQQQVYQKPANLPLLQPQEKLWVLGCKGMKHDGLT